MATQDWVRPKAAEGADVRLVRASRDLRRLAFFRADGDKPGAYVEEVASGEGPRRVCGERVPIEDIGFSPDGAYVAYVVGAQQPFGRERTVGWAECATGAEDGGELGRVGGAAFAWTPKGLLVVADLEEEALILVHPETAVRRVLMPLRDDGDIASPPRIAVSPTGRHIAVACRRSEDDVAEVWLVSSDGPEPRAELCTQVPGADVTISPFWSPKGVTLGLGIVHAGQGQSAVIALRGLRGDGEILHEHALLDAPTPPAWAPGGDDIALFLAAGVPPAPGEPTPQRLALLDTARRQARPVDDVAAAVGTPRFLDDGRLLIDGGAAAHLISLAASPGRRESHGRV